MCLLILHQKQAWYFKPLKPDVVLHIPAIEGKVMLKDTVGY